jgi:hypothetical protein
VIAVKRDVILSHCSTWGRNDMATANEFITEMDADFNMNE